MSEPRGAVYEQLPPDPRLVGWIAYCWRFEAAGGENEPELRLIQIPPEAGVTVTFVERDGAQAISVLSGPHTRAATVGAHRGRTVAGVRFWPGATGALLDVPIATLRDQVVPARLVASRLADALDPVAEEALRTAESTPSSFPALLGEALAPVLPDPESVDQPIYRAALTLLGAAEPPSIASLAADSDLSPRQFRRRFTRAVGLSARDVRRVRRVRATLERAVDGQGTSWARLAVEGGFADQAHFCREFRETTGKSPERYRRDISHIEHRGFEATSGPGVDADDAAESFKTGRGPSP